jgi:hypothetical protein
MTACIDESSSTTSTIPEVSFRSSALVLVRRREREPPIRAVGGLGTEKLPKRYMRNSQ